MMAFLTSVYAKEGLTRKGIGVSGFEKWMKGGFWKYRRVSSIYDRDRHR